MPRIALATSCEHAHLVEEDRRLVPLFATRGVTAVPCVWDDASVDWGSYEGVLLRSVWDYHEKAAAFFSWLKDSGARRMWNAAELVRWNADKRYLADLAAQGVPVVPTNYVTDARELSRAVANWERFVLKPVISAGSRRTQLFAQSEVAEAMALATAVTPDCPMMAQPYLVAIEDPGEVSLCYFGGAFSHAVVKRPAAGDFRVQETFGGTTRAFSPEPMLRSQAEQVLAALPDRPLYARVDGVVLDGVLTLLEVELIEPRLYLDFDGGAADRFVDAACAGLVAQPARP